MSNDRLNAELDRLVNALLCGSLTPEMHQRLSEILQSSPEARVAYFAHIDLHRALKRVNAISPPPNPDVDSQKWEKGRSAAQRRRNAIRRSVLVGSMLLAVGLGAFWGAQLSKPLAVLPSPHPQGGEESGGAPQSPPEIEQVPQVRLLSFAHAELIRDQVPELGAAMQLKHEYTLAKGMLELGFASGATAIVQAPAVFLINSADWIELRNGSCSIHAPENAEGFQVTTPRSKIVDLGTRFSVNVNDEGSSEVQVVEGAAEVHLLGDPAEPATLYQGQANRVSSVSMQRKPIQFDPKQYHRSLPDRVVSYEATGVGTGEYVRDLVSVTVQRQGQLKQYAAEDLIGIEVIHFRSEGNLNNVASDVALPENPTDFLEVDRALTTGLINFANQNSRLDTNTWSFDDYHKRTGLGIRFREPVVNGPGPDVVLFEVQSVVYPLEGDHFRVSPIESGLGLRSFDVTSFDISLNSQAARKVAPFRVYKSSSAVNIPADFSQMQYQQGGDMALPFYAIAVGIDLSELGYPEGAKVNGLFFEDANNRQDVVIDPVFIAGFPQYRAD